MGIAPAGLSEERTHTASLVLRADRVVLPDGIAAATVVVRDGRVAEVRRGDGVPGPADLPLVDLPGLVLSPGLVDSHVHVNEPGRTDWEGFATATRAAAAGGVTTIVDMPLNSVPPTTTVDALRAKQAAASGQLWVDVAFWGGVTSADTRHVGELAAAGVSGVKVFLAPSGVPEFGHLDGEGLTAALAAACRHGLPVLVHAEDPAELAAAPPPAGPRYAGWLASRPAAAEVAAIRQVVAAAARTGGWAHVLHLSAAAALPVLAATRSAGAPVGVETCPHYLSLCAEELPDGATEAKCAPPVRDAANRAELWDGLRAGLIDCVVSDHSPAPAAAKRTGDFATAWGGISGLQTQLPVVWTAAREHGAGPADLARWQSEAPARLAGLAAKGAIAVGKDADLVAWDPDATFVVEPDRLLHRHKLSPWAGRRLAGVVRTTWLRGRSVDPAGPPRGRMLSRDGPS